MGVKGNLGLYKFCEGRGFVPPQRVGSVNLQSTNFIMTTRTERFQRKRKEKEDEVPEEPEEVIRFPPEKEAVSCPVSYFCTTAHPFSVASRGVKCAEGDSKWLVCESLISRCNRNVR